MSHRITSWERAQATLIKKFNKRGMDAYYCATKEEACQKILDLMPENSSIAWGGSESMVEAGVMDAIRNQNYRLIDRSLAKNFQETREAVLPSRDGRLFLMSSMLYRRRGIGKH